MRRYSRYRRSSFVKRRRRRNIIPLLTVLLGIFLVVWLGGRFVVNIFSETRTDTASAQIRILKGRAEFSLPDSEQWTPAYSEQEFLSGDTIRTNSNSKVSLEFLGGNILFLDQNTEVQLEKLEERSSGKKTARIQLKQGRIWARVSDDDFQTESDSIFAIQTPRILVHVRGTILNLSSNEIQDSIRLIKGNVDVDVFTDEAQKEFTNIQVGVGQKLIISPSTLDQIQTGQNVLEIIDAEFIESEWHLQNLERFFPQEAAQIRRRIEISVPANNPSQPEEALPTSQSIESPEILSPENGTTVGADQDIIRIEGTAPLEAAQIVVNGYTLTRFQPGDRKWVYFAAKKFGTLLSGENTFSVVAVSRDGKKSEPAQITLFAEGTGNSSPPSNTSSPSTINSDINEFKSPVITRPAVINLNEPYQTSSDVVTIQGIVDPKTNAIEVNGFRLKEFQPGNTEFRYIANARYGNMKKGENIYRVVAFGPDNKTATTEIKIVYTPLQIGEE